MCKMLRLSCMFVRKCKEYKEIYMQVISLYLEQLWFPWTRWKMSRLLWMIHIKKKSRRLVSFALSISVEQLRTESHEGKVSHFLTILSFNCFLLKILRIQHLRQPVNVICSKWLLQQGAGDLQDITWFVLGSDFSSNINLLLGELVTQYIRGNP